MAPHTLHLLFTHYHGTTENKCFIKNIYHLEINPRIQMIEYWSTYFIFRIHKVSNTANNLNKVTVFL